MPSGLTGERKEAQDTKRTTGKRLKMREAGGKERERAERLKKGWGWGHGWGRPACVTGGRTPSPTLPHRGDHLQSGSNWGARGEEPAQFGECSWIPVPGGASQIGRGTSVLGEVGPTQPGGTFERRADRSGDRPTHPETGTEKYPREKFRERKCALSRYDVLSGMRWSSAQGHGGQA